MGRKEKRDFAVRETESPCDSRGKIVAGTAQQNAKHQATQRIRSSSAGEFAIRSSSLLCVDHAFAVTPSFKDSRAIVLYSRMINKDRSGKRGLRRRGDSNRPLIRRVLRRFSYPFSVFGVRSLFPNEEANGLQKLPARKRGFNAAKRSAGGGECARKRRSGFSDCGHWSFGRRS